MKIQALLILCVLISFPVSAETDLFEEIDRLRKSIVNEDTDYIKSLDPNGNIVTPQNLKYLYDSDWIKQFDTEKKSMKEILSAGNITTFVSRSSFNEEHIYFVYWVNSSLNGSYQLERGKWLKTVGACAIVKINNQWYLYNHLCFAETGGPFIAGF